MSFATRRPSCRTNFRRVRDQLKVSGGWVRCGRCSEVFCALDCLFELEPKGRATEGMARRERVPTPDAAQTDGLARCPVGTHRGTGVQPVWPAAPCAQLALDLALEVPQQRPAGYTVETFYS